MAEERQKPTSAQRLDVNESTIHVWGHQQDVLFKREPDRKVFRGPHRGLHYNYAKKFSEFVTDESGLDTFGKNQMGIFFENC